VTRIRSFLSTSLTGGLLVVVPLWISVFLVGQAIAILRGLIHPIGGWISGRYVHPDLISLGILLLLCFVAGIFVQSRLASSVGDALERNVIVWIPGYRLVRSVLQRMRGEDQDHNWAVALIDFDDTCVPGFVVEELPDGHYPVFVPSVPTPAAGAVYIMEARRVHFVDVPFTAGLRCIAQWGVGTSTLVAARSSQK